MTLVVVRRDALDALLRKHYDLRQAFAVEGGAAGIAEHLEPTDELVTLAVEAGLPISGPMKPGTVPPAPPQRPFDVDRVFELIDQCAELLEDRLDGSDPVGSTYREHGDPRLRCTADGKVVYGTEEQAVAAAKRISDRQPMRHYQGPCGHWHVSRDKRVHGGVVAQAFLDAE